MSEAAIDPMQEVIMQVAAQMMQQQLSATLAAFSEHLLDMQHAFHEGFSERRTYYELSSQLAQPLEPFADGGVETAEHRFESLIGAFNREHRNIMDNFQSETTALRSELHGMVRQVQEEAKEAERLRSDELFNVTNICRREVSATVALLKTETASTGTEVASMASLQQALELTSAELQMARDRNLALQKEVEEARSSTRQQLDDERKKNHSLVSEEREEASKRVRQLMEESEGARSRFMDETAALHSKHATAQERMRQNVEEIRAELDAVRDECDDLRTRETAMQRQHSAAKAEWMRAVTELEVKLAAQTTAAAIDDGDARIRQLDTERLSETKRVLEIQGFKRRLAEATSPIAATASYHGTPRYPAAPTNGRDSFASPMASARSTSTMALDSARGYSTEPRGRPASSPLQQAAMHGTSPHRSPSSSSRLPPYREVSVSSIRTPREASKSPNFSLRSPSETYTKLQQLSSSWRDRLAETGTTY